MWSFCLNGICWQVSLCDLNISVVMCVIVRHLCLDRYKWLCTIYFHLHHWVGSLWVFFSSVLLCNVLFWPVSLLDICTLFPPVLFCYISAGCVQAEHIRWRGDVLPVGRSRGQGRVGTCHRSHHSLNILHHTGQALGSVDSTWPASSALWIRHPSLPPPQKKKSPIQA